MPVEIVELELRRISARGAATPEQRALLETSRFHVPGEPLGTRAVVLECSVLRQQDASYGEHDDDISFHFVLDEPGAPERVSMVWHENIAPQLDGLMAGDVIWVVWGAASLRVITWPDAWRSLVGAVNVVGQSAIPARGEWRFPLCVLGGGGTVLERFTLGNREVLVRELRCEVCLGDLHTALEGTTRTLTAELWSALAVEVIAACGSGGFESLAALRSGLRWTLTGAQRLVDRGQALAMQSVAVASEALVTLMMGNTLVSARAARGAVPSTLTPERAEALRALLTRLGGLEFPSLEAMEAGVRAFATPASRDAALGFVFGLAPRVLEGMKVLQENPQLLPREWDGVYAPPLEGAAALAVLRDRWLENRVGVGSLPERVVPPVRAFVAQPARVNAARPDAPEEQPKARFKWPWQK